MNSPFDSYEKATSLVATTFSENIFFVLKIKILKTPVFQISFLNQLLNPICRGGGKLTSPCTFAPIN